MRVVLIGFVVVLLTLSCGLSIRYNQDASYARDKLDGERYKRIVSEESLQKANIQVGSLEDELRRIKNKVKNIGSILEKTKAFNKDLRRRLDKAAEIKKTLDKKIAELRQLVSPI